MKNYKDFFENEIKIGDEVLITYSGSAGFDDEWFVVGFSSINVKLERKVVQNKYRDCCMKNHENVVVINKLREVSDG